MFGSDPNVVSLQKMIQRVEELEDLTHELKAQHNANDLVEAKTLLLEKEKDLELYRQRVKQLLEKKKTLKALFDEEDLYREFKRQLEGKDQLIKELRVELQRDKNTKMMGEVNLGGQYQNPITFQSERKQVETIQQSQEWLAEKDRWMEKRPSQVIQSIDEAEH